MNRLWYRKPADCWTEALPIGNGQIGAMVFGKPVHEKIQVDESTFWSGAPSEDNNRENMPEIINQVRKLLLDERYEEADPLIRLVYGNKNNYGTNLPVANLMISLCNTVGNYSDYSRSLDISNGIAETDFILDGVKFHREVFVSHQHKVLALKLTADKPAAAGVEIRYDGIENDVAICGHDGVDFLIQGNAFETVHSDGQTGVQLFGRIRVLTVGGGVKYHSQCALVEGADSIIILMALGTTMFLKNPDALCLEQLNQAEASGYDRIKEEHIKDFNTLYRRMQFQLCSEENDDIPTDERIERAQRGEEDQGLISLMFQYGRYLLIASSREDSPLPTHMGGIWNDNTYCRMECTQDMHINLNIQMQYWLAEPCNLSECCQPLFRWMKETIVPSGEKTAALTYNAGGWTAHAVANPWGFTSLGWHINSNWATWALGGVWMAIQLWEHYLYSKDESFLRDVAYPILKGAAQFALDYLFEDPKTGSEMTGPSSSPENQFLFQDKVYRISVSPTCDVLLIREIFQVLLMAADILHCDDILAKQIAAKMSKLPPYKIGRHGQLQEWFHDYDESIPNHRHTSHILGLYPLSQITPEKTPELAKAAKISLMRRQSKDWELTSWTAVFHISYYARLLDTASADEVIKQVFAKLVTPNLFSVMGPIYCQSPLLQNTWELDGNTGFTSAICEMLLQSHDGVIHLLPALPDTWSEGSISGICARGGFEVDIAWRNMKLTEVRLHSKINGCCILKYCNKTIKMEVAQGMSYKSDDTLVFVPELR